jgi:hypothetical protein
MNRSARNQTFLVIWHTMAGGGVITVAKQARMTPSRAGDRAVRVIADRLT